MTLSIIITCLDELAECNATIASLRQTAGDVEIIVVDDASRIPFAIDDPNVKVIRNEQRAGVAASRHIGAIHCKGDVMLLTDAHMRFTPGWFESAMARIKDRPRTLHCATCIGLSTENMNLDRARTEYHGAYIHFHGPDANDPQGRAQILEGKWAKDQPAQDDYPLSCIMGAGYFVPVDFFFHIGGLKLLRGWGGDEPFLSLKWWLAGGDVRMMKAVRIGHQFRPASPYQTPAWNMAYNKMAIIHTCLPDAHAKRLLDQFPREGPAIEARKQIREDAGLLLTEQHHYRSIFVRSFEWYLSTFKLPFPG